MPHLIESEAEAYMLGPILVLLTTSSLAFLLYFEAMLLRELRRAKKRRRLKLSVLVVDRETLRLKRSRRGSLSSEQTSQIVY